MSDLDIKITIGIVTVIFIALGYAVLRKTTKKNKNE